MKSIGKLAATAWRPLGFGFGLQITFNTQGESR
jgi:hypothetical protein